MDWKLLEYNTLTNKVVNVKKEYYKKVKKKL